MKLLTRTMGKGFICKGLLDWRDGIKDPKKYVSYGKIPKRNFICFLSVNSFGGSSMFQRPKKKMPAMENP